MRLFHRLFHDVKAGWANLRYGTALAAERARVTAEVEDTRTHHAT